MSPDEFLRNEFLLPPFVGPTIFFGSYSTLGIAHPPLPTLSRPVSPVGSSARHMQQHHDHLGELNDMTAYAMYPGVGVVAGLWI